MTRSRWTLVIAGMISLGVLTEAAVRQAGLADFPVYVRSDSFGYVPRSNQAGAFLGRNRWVFNDRSMGVDRPWQPSGRTDILLIGNSIIMGGNPYDQEEKVTPLLQARIGEGCPVWPVAAGGWSTVNEMRFLQSNPDLVASSNFFIWEYMPGQMQGLNPWTRESLHPTERPLWATGYVVRKALEARFPSLVPARASPAAEAADHYREYDAMLARLATASGRRPAGLIFLYPDREQLGRARSGQEWVADRDLVRRLASDHGVVLIDIAEFPQWNEPLYKDPVHPTAEGNAVLAEILSSAIGRSLSDAGCTRVTARARLTAGSLRP